MWIPTSTHLEGLYAHHTGISGPLASTTRHLDQALAFATREACRAWCDRTTDPQFLPTYHESPYLVRT
jgi:hypothetical protein